MKTRFLTKNVSGPFTIPSGIVATTAATIEYIIRHIPAVGVITTKSIGPEPRPGNREPILSQYAPGCFINAVGLTNPGAEESARLLAALEVPEDRFLLTSIFGGSIEEFVSVARLLAPFSDGLELNLSCPHARGYGMEMGQDADLVCEITRAVKEVAQIPVIPKLSPNVRNLAEIARAAEAGGADAICAINTVGPGYHPSHGFPVLTNRYGGLSGKGVLPIGLKCVEEIKSAVGLPVIGCGGISGARDVNAYRDAGATIFGVGSALIGLSSIEMQCYFERLEADLAEGGDEAEGLIRYDVDMGFEPCRVVETRRIAQGLAVITCDRAIEIEAGEFIFVWIPGVGEKPFSVLRDDPLTLVVIEQGLFTGRLVAIAEGSELYVRGPYGIPVQPPAGARIMAVSGGTGLAGVYQIARDFGNAEIFFGARSSDRLYWMEECAGSARLHIATDDGSEGYHGLVTDLLRKRLEEMNEAERGDLVFYNCGPDAMVHAAEALELEFAPRERIWSAIDYVMRCGVGICGSCSSPDGRRSCVDGPFLCANE